MFVFYFAEAGALHVAAAKGYNKVIRYVMPKTFVFIYYTLDTVLFIRIKKMSLKKYILSTCYNHNQCGLMFFVFFLQTKNSSKPNKF